MGGIGLIEPGVLYLCIPINPSKKDTKLADLVRAGAKELKLNVHESPTTNADYAFVNAFASPRMDTPEAVRTYFRERYILRQENYPKIK